MSAWNSRLNHAWVHDELARSSEPSRARGSFTLGTQLGCVTLVRGRSRRFAESHLASGRKIVLDADTMFIPDPILPWVKSARLHVLASHDKSSGLCSGLRSDVMVWV
jgi:hypothetical protein